MAPSSGVFTSTDQVLQGRFKAGNRINAIGVVVDFRAPIATRGEDFKSQIRFYDESTQSYDSPSLSLVIFRKLDAMPNPASGDVVVIFGAKVQTFGGEFSIMTSWTTDIYIFSAANIPSPPKDARNALQAVGKNPNRALTAADYMHVSAFHHSISKDRVPSTVEFDDKKAQSMQARQKFSLLKDISPGIFVDVIAEVVKPPYDQAFNMGDMCTLWISDYTENSDFYNFALKGLGTDGQSDPYNYTVGPSISDDDWSGPYGKHSLQITCYDANVQEIRSQNITAGTWVSLKNLQIKYGRNSSNLEGYLRGDRSNESKVYISVLDHLEEGDSMDPRLKETIRRRRDYERQRKQQLKTINEAAAAGQKRRAALDEDTKPRKSASKRRRNEKRQAARNTAQNTPNPDHEQSAAEAEAPRIRKIKLNSSIKCENDKQPISTLAELLEQIHFETLVGAEAIKLPLPFINANYRAHVRVKDYLPRRLEDFAYPKMKKSIYGALSDDEDVSSDEDAEKLDRFVTAETLERWEWRFYLQLEEADEDGDGKKDTIWVAVDNHAAQCLLNLNAGDLRNSKRLLGQLREKLFYLWGELEERNTQVLLRREQAERHARANRPPADSDDEDMAGNSAAAAPANRPFACCIRQYGVKLSEPDDTKADAGPGKRWQRMYGLFGTQIATSSAE